MNLLDPTWDGEVTLPDGTSARAVQLARHAGAARLGATRYELDPARPPRRCTTTTATRSSCSSWAARPRCAPPATPSGRCAPGRSSDSRPAATAPIRFSTTPTGPSAC